MDLASRPFSRRETLALLGGAALAGCSAAGRDARNGQAQQQQSRTVRGFVGSYHWGFFLLDDTGTERDRLSLSTGDELRLTLFNVEADDAVAALPAAVREGIPGSEERARRNEQSIPAPRGTDLDALHETAEAAYPDHGLALVRDEYLRQGTGGFGGPGQGPGPGPGGHHGPGWGGGPHGPGTGPGMGGLPGGTAAGALAPSTYLWHRSTVPAELGFVVDATGSFGFACTVYCGYGHPYMVAPGTVVVDGE
ncbi:MULTISPECIES: hypothetical protein [Salinibaculum]|uniref:hypothetical protein n=1 Tax=Salinibaculum TaxID=2732368 RepID=UPI0030CACF04